MKPSKTSQKSLKKPTNNNNLKTDAKANLDKNDSKTGRNQDKPRKKSLSKCSLSMKNLAPFAAKQLIKPPQKNLSPPKKTNKNPKDSPPKKPNKILKPTQKNPLKIPIKAPKTIAKPDPKELGATLNIKSLQKSVSKTLEATVSAKSLQKQENKYSGGTINASQQDLLVFDNKTNERTISSLLFLTRQKSKTLLDQQTEKLTPALHLPLFAVQRPDFQSKISTFSRSKTLIEGGKSCETLDFPIFDEERALQFEIKDVLLGAGANGNVYKILDKVNKGSFALKIMEMESGECDSGRKCGEVINEIAIMEKLKGLNSGRFIRIESVFLKKRDIDKKSSVFLVMELCDCNLQEILEVRAENVMPYTEAELLYYFSWLYATMQAMHRLGIAHRDLKCRNILYRDSMLRFADFGESKDFSQVGQADDLTNTVRGTPLFMSPEVFSLYQKHCFEGKYDAFSSDYYSLGLTFLMMKYGTDLTRAEVEQVLARNCKESSSLSSKIIERMMKEDSKERKKGTDEFFGENSKVFERIGKMADETAVINLLRLKREKTDSQPESFKKLYLIASMYYKMKNLEKAREIYLEILGTISPKKGIPLDFVDLIVYKSLFELGRVENDLFKLKRDSSSSFPGIERLEKAFEILTKRLIHVFPEETYKSEFGDLLNELGISNKNLGNIDKGLFYYKKSLEFATEIFGEKSYNCAVTNHNLGEIYFESGDYLTCRVYFEKSLEINESLVKNEQNHEYVRKLQAEIHRSLNNLGLCFLKTGDFEKARLSLIRCRQGMIDSQDSDFFLLGEVLNNLGFSEMKLEREKEAEVMFHEGLKLAESMNLPEIKALSFFNLGNLQFEQSENAKAEESFRAAAKVYEELGGENLEKSEIMGNLYYNLGVIGQRIESKEKARSYFSKALEFYEGAGHKGKIEEINRVKNALIGL